MHQFVDVTSLQLTKVWALVVSPTLAGTHSASLSGSLGQIIIFFIIEMALNNTPVLAQNEPPNQTGTKVTFCSQIAQRMQQLRLWVPWVPEGYIYPFPIFAQGWNGLSKTLEIRARTAVALHCTHH